MTDREAARGRFITFEGGEGAGKSTHLRMLAARLAACGVETIATREPGGTPHAEKLRDILLSGAAQPLGPLAEAALFSAARVDHVDRLIAPALARGAFVLCDRFTDSTRAYQGALGQVDERALALLETIAVGDTRPDLTIMLDLPAAEGLARAAKRRDNAQAADRFERESETFHEGLRTAFLAIADREPHRCCVVDARQSQDDVAEAIWAIVEARFLRQGTPAP